MNKIHKYKKGYTLIEALIYIAVFIVISVVVIALIMSILETSREVSPINSLSRSAASSLEKITREIRSASSLDLPNSILGDSSGVLSLNTLDINNIPKIVKFYLDSDIVKINENSVYIGPLNSADTKVTAIFFNLATSSNQNLVKIEMDVTAGNGKYEKSEKFYSSVVVRSEN